MKKIISAIFALSILAMVSTSNVVAHSGNTDYQGCHTCYTNCPSYGLSYGEYHCHTPKYTVTTPTCPIFSSYNSITESCECYSGYVASGSQCISQDQRCRDQLGYSSRYNSISNTCECSYGYVIDGSGKCSSGNSVCWNKYGYNSKYNSLNNSCECNYGYVFNQSGNKCISQDESCQESYGYGSKANIMGDKCECKTGYEWEGGKCVLETLYTEPVYIPTRTDTPTPSTKTILNPKVSNPTSEATPTTSSIPNDTGDLEINNGIFLQIWNFIKNLVGF